MGACVAVVGRQQAKLDALALDKGPEQLKSEYATMSLAELDNRQPEIMANMQEAQEALGTIGSQITNLQTLPERAQASMSRAYQRSQEIRTRLNGLQNQGDPGPGALKLMRETLDGNGSVDGASADAAPIDESELVPAGSAAAVLGEDGVAEGGPELDGPVAEGGIAEGDDGVASGAPRDVVWAEP